jgi:hypothetical protein
VHTDTRRRKETLVKLLRQIDKVKVDKLLNEGKVTQDHVILLAAMQSRGLSLNERIRLTVDALNIERG